jgi:crotonobetainyl-CoA:carnitine CoA-transferase CaiB-like acyl-CoA transferase
MTTISGPLTGVRVIDLSRVLGGPYCTQLLGDLGADVIKVEPPQGDETRGWGPPFAEDGTSAYFLGVNRNKKSVVLDLAQPAGREALLKLLDGADALIENFKTGTLEKWGIGNDVISSRAPRLVHCRISGFGADGPLGGLPGYDAVVQAMAGLMSVNGSRESGPLRVGLPVVDMVTGLYAAVGILAALRERDASGRGQFVEAALYDCGISLLHPYLANFLVSGKKPTPTGNAHPNIYPYDLFQTATEPIFLAIGNDTQFTRLVAALGADELATDPRYRENRARSVNRDALKQDLERLLSTHASAAIAERLAAVGVPCGPVLDIDAVARHPHTLHRGMLVEFDGYRGAGAPIKFSRTPATYRLPPPSLNQHAEQVLPADLVREDP